MSKINLSPSQDPYVAAASRLRVEFHGTGGLAVYPPGATFGPRTLRDFEFVWILDGHCQWEADGRTYPAPPGAIILCRPGMRDGFRWDRERQTRHAYFHFGIHSNGAELPAQEHWPAVGLMPEGDILRPLFRHVSWLLAAGKPEWVPLAEISARQLLLSFLTGAYRTSAEGGVDFSEPVLRAMQFVQDWWERGRRGTPTLGELARAAAVSQGHLCRLFRAEVGHAPLQALRLMRVDRAAALLARTNLRIKAVADQFGFESQFHFSRCFREAYGCSPREFRKRAEQGQAMPAVRVLNVRRFAGAWVKV